jgi:hypothetical protein
MVRKRNHFAAALVAVLTGAAIFEVYYFGFQLPGEEARDRRELDQSISKRQEQAAVEKQIAARSIRLQAGNEGK